MIKSDRSKELLLSILRPCFFEFEEWSVELVEGAIEKQLDSSEVLEQIFRFRTVILNFLEQPGCPRELVDEVYFGQVIKSMCGARVAS